MNTAPFEIPDPPPCTFRPATPEDEPFVLELFGIILRSQMPLDLIGLSPDELNRVLEHQYRAMMLHYDTNYPWAEVSIVLRNGEPVGRLIIIEFENELRLGDLMILPWHQNNGICTYIMRTYVAKGLAANKKIRLHVEKPNRAVRLYKREGFAIVEDLSSHWLMQYGATELELQDT